MDVLVEIEDEILRLLELMAKSHKRSLNEELLDILRRTAKEQQGHKRMKKKP